MKKNNKNSKELIISLKPLGVLVSLFGISFIGLVVLFISVLGVDQKESHYVNIDPEVSVSDDVVGPAYISLKEDRKIAVLGNQAAVDVVLDTDTELVDGVDVVLTYDPDVVSIDAVTYGSVFDSYMVRDDESGEIVLSAWKKDVAGMYRGRGVISTVFFTPKKTDVLKFDIVCQKGSTDDTNINFRGKDLVNCERNVGTELAMEGEYSGNEKDLALNYQNEVYVQTLDTEFVEIVDDEGFTSPLTVSGQMLGSFITAGCEYQTPIRPNGLKAVTGDNSGEVKLSWNKVNGASHYTVTYGEKWLEFNYGNSNLGDVDHYVVSGLKPGVGYYFVVTAVNICASSGYSDGAAAYAGGGAEFANASQDYDWDYQDVNASKGSVVKENNENDGINEASESGEWKDSRLDDIDRNKDDVIVYTDEFGDNSGNSVASIIRYLPWVGALVLLLLTGILLWYSSEKKRQHSKTHHKGRQANLSFEKKSEKEKLPKKPGDDIEFPEGWGS